MKEEKLKEISEAMQGITYLDWVKVRTIFDLCFDVEADSLKNKIQVAGVEKIVESFKRNWSLL